MAFNFRLWPLENLPSRSGADNKTGVFTAAFAVHPLTGEDVPDWIADYVLSSYTTRCGVRLPGTR